MPVGDPSATGLPSAEDLTFYHVDHLGSTTLLTDSLGGVVEHIRYRAFGEIRGIFTAAFALKGSDASSSSSDFGFTGQRTERGLDLLYYNARFYDPEMGLFLQIDPKREFASPYAYVGYDPVNANDPTGEGFWLVAIVIAAIMAAATFIDVLVRTGDLGAAFKAGLMSFAIGVATAGLTYGALQTGVGQLAAKAMSTAAGKALAVGASGFGAIQSFKQGNIATGIASLGVAAWGIANTTREASTSIEALRERGYTGTTQEAAGMCADVDGVPVYGDVEAYDVSKAYLLGHDPSNWTQQNFDKLAASGRTVYSMADARSHVITPSASGFQDLQNIPNSKIGDIVWNPFMAGIGPTGQSASPALALGHEIEHAVGANGASEAAVRNGWERYAATALGEGVRGYDPAGGDSGMSMLSPLYRP